MSIGAAATARDDRVARLTADLSGALGVGASLVESFVSRYLQHVDDDDLLRRPEMDLREALASHYRLGAARRPGEPALALFTPRDDGLGWEADGSTLIQVVTDDRPFLVDSLTMELTRRHWTIREVYHPQFGVHRDEAGVLQDLGPQAAGWVPESWIHLEVFPPLGSAAAELVPALGEAFADVLRDVEVAVADHEAMRQRLRHTVAGLADVRPPVDPEAVAFLTWLLDEHFTFLAAEDYRVRDGAYEAVPGSALGTRRRRGSGRNTFHAVPLDPSRRVLVVTKDTERATVHRAGRLDYVGVRSFDAEGRLVGERRFLGLLSSRAYTDSVADIPLISAKLAALVARSEYDPASHGAKALVGVVETYPRDELFQASVEELYPIVSRIAGLTERRQVRVFARADPWGRAATVLVYFPRDRYNTDVREGLQRALLTATGAESVDFQARLTESTLARLAFVVTMPPARTLAPLDLPGLEALLTQVVRGWEDAFLDVVADLPSEQRGIDFSDAYTDDFTPAEARAELLALNTLAGPDDLSFDLVDPRKPEDPADLRFKIRRLDGTLSLFEVMPHLSRLGVDVIDEWPYELRLRGRDARVYDFGLLAPGARATRGAWDEAGRRRFIEAFEASYRGRTEADDLNALVVLAGLTWVEVSWLRALSRYLQQLGIPSSQGYIAACLRANHEIAALLVEAFRVRFDPGWVGEDRRSAARAALDAVLAAVDGVASLDHDRILRAFVAVLAATVRTNAFTGGDLPLALKLHPREIDLAPQPRPTAEIYAHSPRVEGVHLRFGPIARGGLRWSDRPEDYRTEVLGLVKAQVVKNAVIVPTGAKGGFVTKHPAADPAARQAEGVACYQQYIRALLSVTDDVVDGTVRPPVDVVRWDGDDPYLVVAADKGTAAFSDVANEIALERGFWLGDAFASGGSAGYDHKAMGITARGAWESVKAHFASFGVDCQSTDVTCVGIGDMSGDVFGNAMLQSRHLRLVAAFDHRHVFLDPDPDAERGSVERARLFALPRSSWADYDETLLSAGGGVFPRSLKALPVSPEVRRSLGLDDDVDHLTPDEMISAILRAPVDLLFNGGIGTYVKASGEPHSAAGDRTNDAVRVDASTVRARVVGEGGNLGWTQAARIEYAEGGGRINTDFIDNSAGVDTSDHEVNIKILLDAEVVAGRLARDERDPLLSSMTDEVARLVLAHNVSQNFALDDAEAQALDHGSALAEWLDDLESVGLLQRQGEALPTSEALAQRAATGRGLTRPELSSLLAWTKIRLIGLLEDADLPDDPALIDLLVGYFPAPLRDRFRAAIAAHPLRRQIVATVLVNAFVDRQGITAYHRIATDTGAELPDVLRATLVARALVGADALAAQVPQVSGSAQGRTRLRLDLQRFVEDVARWVLRDAHAGGVDIAAVVERYAGPTAEVMQGIEGVLPPLAARSYRRDVADAVEQGVPEPLARGLAAAPVHCLVPGVVRIARDLDRDLRTVASVFFTLRERLSVPPLLAAVAALPQPDPWASRARAGLLADVHETLDRLTREALAMDGDADDVVAAWERRVGVDGERAAEVAALLQEPDLARVTVALRGLKELARP